MIRSEHLLIAAFGLAMLAAVCVGMLALQCDGCALHTLNVIAANIIGGALLLGGGLIAAAGWSTRRLWHTCHHHALPHPPILQQVCRRLDLPNNHVVYVDQREVFVFCLGWLRPKIVVSSGLVQQVSARELAAILAHERRHQQRRDPLRLLAMKIMHLMLYPLPAMRDFYQSFVALLEIEADQAAMTTSGRPALAGAMYKMISRPAPSRIGSLAAVLTPFSASDTRLEHLLDPHHNLQLPLSTPRLAMSLLPFLVLCLSMFVA